MSGTPRPVPEHPELVIGVLGSSASEREAIERALSAGFDRVGYSIIGLGPTRGETASVEERTYPASTGAPGAEGITAVRAERQRRSGAPDIPLRAVAYVLRDLAGVESIEALRAVYEDRFVLVGMTPHPSAEMGDEECATRDAIAAMLALADVVVPAEPAAVHVALQRFVRVLFGDPFETPGPDEQAMFHAWAASLRSAAMSRQVGAVAMDHTGSIIAVGANEVAASGGGSYWYGDPGDHRDHVGFGVNSSDRMKRRVVEDVLRRLADGGWLAPHLTAAPIPELVEAAVWGPEPVLAQSRVMDSMEFSRAVHAETAVVADAARRGASLAGATLLTTMFPCHMCAPVIVAAGIARVIWLEPSPKSLVANLYEDSVAVDPGAAVEDRVVFSRHLGVAPRRFAALFTAPPRRDQRGRALPWSGATAAPRVSGSQGAGIRREAELLGMPNQAR